MLPLLLLVFVLFSYAYGDQVHTWLVERTPFGAGIIAFQNAITIGAVLNLTGYLSPTGGFWLLVGMFFAMRLLLMPDTIERRIIGFILRR